MSISIRTRVARPPLLIGGTPKATMGNILAGLVVFCFVEEILLAILSLVVGQSFVFYKTYRNPYFFNEILADLKCRNHNAKNKQGIEEYV